MSKNGQALDTAFGVNPLREGLRSRRPRPAIPSSSSAAPATSPPASSSPPSTNLERNACSRRHSPSSALAAVRWTMRATGARQHEATTSFSRTGKPDPELWNAFQQGLYYVRGDFSTHAGYEDLKRELAEIETRHGTGGNRIFYLATQPSLFPRDHSPAR